MNSIKIQANAKVNLFLDITGKRADGYHLLDTVMLSCGIYDRVTLQKTDGGIQVSCDAAEIPAGSDNIAWKAADLFFRRTGIAGGAAIHIEKRIPSRAGMGGGSTDAAAVLQGLNQLYDSPLSPEDLWETGAAVGADVPFCLRGGCMELTGSGDRARKVLPIPRGWLLLCKAEGGISTPAAYGELDRVYPLCAETALSRGALLTERLERGAPLRGGTGLYNCFEKILPALDPGTEKVLTALRSFTPAALLTGSGNAVFGWFSTRCAANRAAAGMSRRFPGLWTAVAAPEESSLITEEIS